MKTIMKLLVVSFLLTSVIPINAQTAELYQMKINKLKTVKTIGIVLMGASVPIGSFGAYCIIHGNNVYKEEDWSGFLGGLSEIFWGDIFVCLAGVSLVSGTVMTIIGVNKMKQYQSKLDGLKVGAFFTPNHAGLTLTYRF
jgi:hypothetical protein